jgi:hypothetical protein
VTSEDFPPREHDRRPRARLDSEHVDPREDEQRQYDRDPLPDATARAGPEVADGAREKDGEARDRRDASDPRHPADLEPDEVSERLARVDDRASRAVEEARRLREAKDQQQDREPRGEDGPHARGPEQLRRRDRQDQIDAAADDVVDRQRDDLPARDRAEESCPLVEPLVSGSQSADIL